LENLEEPTPTTTTTRKYGAIVVEQEVKRSRRYEGYY
jgi:hypothetical protein